MGQSNAIRRDSSPSVDVTCFQIHGWDRWNNTSCNPFSMSMFWLSTQYSLLHYYMRPPPSSDGLYFDLNYTPVKFCDCMVVSRLPWQSLSTVRHKNTLQNAQKSFCVSSHHIRCLQNNILPLWHTHPRTHEGKEIAASAAVSGNQVNRLLIWEHGFSVLDRFTLCISAHHKGFGRNCCLSYNNSLYGCFPIECCLAAYSSEGRRVCPPSHIHVVTDI